MARVFVSRPNVLKKGFEAAHDKFEAFLRTNSFEPKTLGRTAYSLDSPLGAVIALMKSCSGAIILGYPQYILSTMIIKGAKVESDTRTFFPTPWNQIEGVLAYQLGLPVLVIAHTGISGGLFDYGVLGRFIFTADLENPQWFRKKDKRAILTLWKREVWTYGKKKSFY